MPFFIDELSLRQLRLKFAILFTVKAVGMQLCYEKFFFSFKNEQKLFSLCFRIM